MLQTPIFLAPSALELMFWVMLMGGARQKVAIRERVPMVDFTFLLKSYGLDRSFAILGTLDVTHPNFSPAFGARADVLGYVDGGCAPNISPS